jgi:hypothetical protein
MSDKTLNQRKLELIVFVALTDNEEILYKIEEILDQLEDKKNQLEDKKDIEISDV